MLERESVSKYLQRCLVVKEVEVRAIGSKSVVILKHLCPHIGFVQSLESPSTRQVDINKLDLDQPVQGGGTDTGNPRPLNVGNCSSNRSCKSISGGVSVPGGVLIISVISVRC